MLISLRASQAATRHSAEFVSNCQSLLFFLSVGKPEANAGLGAASLPVLETDENSSPLCCFKDGKKL